MSPNSSKFHERIDLTQQQIEDILDDSEADIDIENSNGILTLVFEDASQIILSRQEALSQLWAATRLGGFHFDYDDQQQCWVCTTTRRTLGNLLADWCQSQGQISLSFPGL